MSRVKFTATWPAKPAGAEVTWPGSARVYLDRDSHRPVAEAYLDRDRRVVVWSESSVTLTCGGEALTCSSGSPTQTGAAVAGSGLPVPGSGDAGKVVTVTDGEDGFELDAPTGGASEPWVEVAVPTAEGDYTIVDGNTGTWVFDAGTIAQTDPEGAGTIVSAALSIEDAAAWAVEFDLTITAQSGADTTGFSVGVTDPIQNPAANVYLNGVDATQPNVLNVSVGYFTGVTVGLAKRTFRVVTNGTVQALYLDGALVGTVSYYLSLLAEPGYIFTILTTSGAILVENMRAWAIRVAQPPA